MRLGELNMKSEGEPIAHQDKEIIKVIIHPRFDNFTKEYDIALLKIDDRGIKFKVSNHIPFNYREKQIMNELNYYSRTLFQYVCQTMMTIWRVSRVG